MEDTLILLSPQSRRAVSLNESAAILWEALVNPSSLEDLSDLAAEAKPDRSQVTIRKEIEALLTQLLKEQLIVTAETA